MSLGQMNIDVVSVPAQTVPIILSPAVFVYASASRTLKKVLSFTATHSLIGLRLNLAPLYGRIRYDLHREPKTSSGRLQNPI